MGMRYAYLISLTRPDVMRQIPNDKGTLNDPQG